MYHDRCIWQCPGRSLYHECEGGQWSEEPGLTRCMCPKLGSSHPGEVLCHPPVGPEEAVASGTYCLHTCHGHTKTEMMCQHSLWSTSPDTLTCEGSNATSFANLRGKSLDMDTQVNHLKENMGSLAFLKIAEMKSKEVKKKPIMKTKVSSVRAELTNCNPNMQDCETKNS